jgi:hypothetical protein
MRYVNYEYLQYRVDDASQSLLSRMPCNEKGPSRQRLGSANIGRHRHAERSFGVGAGALMALQEQGRNTVAFRRFE